MGEKLKFQPELNKFPPNILKEIRRVKEFKDARKTSIPRGETIFNQHDIKYNLPPHMQPTYFDPSPLDHSGGHFETSPTKRSEIIYFPYLFPHTEEKMNLFETEYFVNNLPKIPGVHWIVPEVAQLGRILTNHFKKTGEYILELREATWTRDNFISRDGNVEYLTVSNLRQYGISINGIEDPLRRYLTIGVFVLGIPNKA